VRGHIISHSPWMRILRRSHPCSRSGISLTSFVVLIHSSSSDSSCGERLYHMILILTLGPDTRIRIAHKSGNPYPFGVSEYRASVLDSTEV
jgi:hypothetical protein